MTPDEAKQAFAQGLYAEAAPELRAIADKAPKNAAANTMAGVALAKIGDFKAARTYLARGTNEAKITLAEIEFDEYRFDEAEEILDKYTAAQKKARKPVSEEADALMERIETAKAMLDRVEKIVIIDSIAVPKENFFEAYRLAASAGSIQGAQSLSRRLNPAEGSTAFTSDNSSTLIWGTPEDDHIRLAQTWQLADGSWEEPTMLGSALNEGGDANFPFLMSDGITLYFANNGENSLGGYDIFISRFDGEKFLQPQNIGMPYNSPYDDYLLAIDEETGIGWWATDRNRLGDYITIYKFIPQELRINYPVDTENLGGLARLTDYRRTWDYGKDYSDLIAASERIKEVKEYAEPELVIPMPDGRLLTPKQLRSSQARALAGQYVSRIEQLEEKEASLARLRKEYSHGNRSGSGAILDAEANIERLRNEIASLRNRIVNAEMPAQ